MSWVIIWEYILFDFFFSLKCAIWEDRRNNAFF
jgi:hypothetical protein